MGNVYFDGEHNTHDVGRNLFDDDSNFRNDPLSIGPILRNVLSLVRRSIWLIAAITGTFVAAAVASGYTGDRAGAYRHWYT
jgi:hypothetical protein